MKKLIYGLTFVFLFSSSCAKQEGKKSSKPNPEITLEIPKGKILVPEEVKLEVENIHYYEIPIEKTAKEVIEEDLLEEAKSTPMGYQFGSSLVSTFYGRGRNKWET